MTFQIHALPPAPFAPLFELSDAELAERCARRLVVDAEPGYPCRVSLEDARVGETVILVNYTHQAERTPYRASHAVFAREGAAQARPAPGVAPAALKRRLLSIRGFDAAHQMIAADVVDGAEIEPALAAAFGNPAVAYIHLHHAKQGCYAARATRVG